MTDLRTTDEALAMIGELRQIIQHIPTDGGFGQQALGALTALESAVVVLGRDEVTSGPATVHPGGLPTHIMLKEGLV